MSGDIRIDPIPGNRAAGACPDCGGWKTPGMLHDCDAERERQAEQAQQIADLFWPTNSHSEAERG